MPESSETAASLPQTFEHLESRVRSYSRHFPALFDRAEGPWLYAREGSDTSTSSRAARA